MEGHIKGVPSAAGAGVVGFPESVEARSCALSGQVYVESVPSLTSTLGARMTWERKSGRFAGFKAYDGRGLPPPLGSLAGYDVTGKKSWKAFTTRFARNWKATDDVLTYASVARG